MARRNRTNPRNQQGREPQETLRRIPKKADFNGEPVSEDFRAEEEASLIANGRDLQRSESFKDLLHLVVMVMMWIIAIGVGLSLVIWFYHLLSPAAWNFLKDEQLRRIETVVFSGVLVSVAQTFIGRHL